MVVNFMTFIWLIKKFSLTLRGSIDNSFLNYKVYKL